MTTHDDLHRDMGRMDAEIGTLKMDVGQIKADVRTILNTLAEARGSWKTLLAVAGLAGTLGAAIASLFPFVTGK